MHKDATQQADSFSVGQVSINLTPRFQSHGEGVFMSVLTLTTVFDSYSIESWEREGCRGPSDQLFQCHSIAQIGKLRLTVDMTLLSPPTWSDWAGAVVAYKAINNFSTSSPTELVIGFLSESSDLWPDSFLPGLWVSAGTRGLTTQSLLEGECWSILDHLFAMVFPKISSSYYTFSY